VDRPARHLLLFVVTSCNLFRSKLTAHKSGPDSALSELTPAHPTSANFHQMVRFGLHRCLYCNPPNVHCEIRDHFAAHRKGDRSQKHLRGKLILKREYTRHHRPTLTRLLWAADGCVELVGI